MNQPSEKERIAAAQAGDPEALDGWFREHHPSVYRLCLGFLADAVAAEDLCQDAMLHLLDRLQHWDPARSFSAWRNSIVLNLCRDRLRKLKRRERAELGAAPLHLPNPSPAPEDGLARREAQEVLQVALRSLPPREREAFVLRDLEGSATAEVALAMQVSESTVRSLTTLARRRLRGLLAESLGQDPEGGTAHA
ncbi:MAG: RNA polymerase sigma factor [Planctomycetota bacterium]|jgi:RNA polymerase sigma-70 factor (ECF subfamily)